MGVFFVFLFWFFVCLFVCFCLLKWLKISFTLELDRILAFPIYNTLNGNRMNMGFLCYTSEVHLKMGHSAHHCYQLPRQAKNLKRRNISNKPQLKTPPKYVRLKWTELKQMKGITSVHWSNNFNSHTDMWQTDHLKIVLRTQLEEITQGQIAVLLYWLQHLLLSVAPGNLITPITSP